MECPYCSEELNWHDYYLKRNSAYNKSYTTLGVNNMNHIV